MSDNTPSLVGKEISGCEILNKVAVGGMGAVYRARHKALNRIVCVKILNPSLANDKKAVQLFLTEARAIAELEHPNIVNVYNVGKENGFYFIVMSFVEGQTLSQMLKSQKVLPIGKVLDLFDEVLQGLAAAHEKGIIHRDIKPSNILITPQGQAKVVDFGIAKKVDKDKRSTKTTELAGTAYFIAPEQAVGKDLDVRADLYSIGASLYYVLTGRFPYGGKNAIDIIQKHINEPVPDASKLRQDIPMWLSLAIQKLMSKNPNDRFSSAKETYIHFRKMRAEEQLNVTMKGGDKAVDIRNEGSLKIMAEEKFVTQQIKKDRQQIEQTKPSVEVVQNVSSIPSLDAVGKDPVIPNRKPAKQEEKNPTMASTFSINDSKATPVYPKIKKTLRGKTISKVPAALAEVAVKTLLAVPLFLVLAFANSYLFWSFGKLVSVHVSDKLGIISNLFAPIFTSNYVPNQFSLLGMCFGAVVVIFMLGKLKWFSKSVICLLLISLVSYMSGLFVPDIDFLKWSVDSFNLLSPEYYYIYLLLALLVAFSVLGIIHRSVAQGLFAATLIGSATCLAYCVSLLSVPAATHSLVVQVLFAGGLFAIAIAAIYSMGKRDLTFSPRVLTLLGILLIWICNVSGMYGMLNNSFQSLREVVNQGRKVTTPENASRNIAIQTDHNNEFSSVVYDEAVADMEARIDKIAPDLLNSSYKPLYVEWLVNSYRGGKSLTKMKIWDYAITFPIRSFSENARNNASYSYFVYLLIVLGCVNCFVSIAYGEKYE